MIYSAVKAYACALVILLSSTCAWAADAPANRIALVIGVGNYQTVTPLVNPTRDAKAIAEKLRALNFKVFDYYDPSGTELRRAVRNFGIAAGDADAAVVYYAGHGMQVNGRNYLIPADAQLQRDQDLKYEALELELVMSETSNAHKVGVVFLDACRNNPFIERLGRSVAVRAMNQKGLARIDTPTNMAVLMATRADEVAEDGAGDHSPFSAAILHNLDEPGLEVLQLFRKVKDTVMKVTHNRQEPFFFSSLSAEPFYINVSKQVAQAPAGQPGGKTAVDLNDPAVQQIIAKLIREQMNSGVQRTEPVTAKDQAIFGEPTQHASRSPEQGPAQQPAQKDEQVAILEPTPQPPTKAEKDGETARKRKAEEEKAKADQEKADRERAAAEAKKKQLQDEQARAEAERRRQTEEAAAAAAEAKRNEDARKAAEAARAQADRDAAEAKKREEAAKKADEKKAALEAKKQADRDAAEAKRAEDEAKKKEAAARSAEEKKAAEAQRKEEARQRAEKERQDMLRRLADEASERERQQQQRVAEEARRAAEERKHEQTVAMNGPPPRDTRPPAAPHDTRPLLPTDLVYGAWCGAGFKIEITNSRWIYSLPAGDVTYQVKQITSTPDAVLIRWEDSEYKTIITEFTTFLGNTMVQSRARNAGDQQWSVYNRTLQRCQPGSIATPSAAPSRRPLAPP